MEEIVWVNGQDELDFDYLLKRTNQSFVNAVTSFLTMDGGFERVSIRTLTGAFCEVVVVLGTSIAILSYSPREDRYEKVFVSTAQVKRALGLM